MELTERKKQILKVVVDDYIHTAEPVGSKVIAQRMGGVSSATITKMGKNGYVATEILVKICTALNCTMDDIMEIVPD